jgi:cytochrome c oxidase subunit 2
MALAIVIILLVIGSLLFHFLSPWWFTPIASNWGAIDTTVNITFWVTGIVFVLLNCFLAYTIVRFRHKKGSRSHYEPENKKLELWLIGITSVGVIAMLAPGLFVWAKFVNVPEGAAEVEAVGQQWRWSYRYPGADGVFGTTDVSHMSIDNPFGMNPDDPDGQDDILVNSNDMHLPIDQPVKILLRSKDVLHNFAVAQFRVKMDMVPGMVTYLWLTPTRTGAFDILCEELCGVAHFAMRGRVIVQEEADFQTWLASQPTFAQTMAQAGSPARGRALYATCAGCHGQQGEGNVALNSPKLGGMEAWSLEKQLQKFRKGVRGFHENDTYGKQMVAFAATLTTDMAIKDVAAYINTLTDSPVPTTVTGNINNGRRLYVSCGACHGTDGKGNWATGAPRLTGINDWYLQRQLSNFRAGVRGTHPDDGLGKQMAIVSDMLTSEQAVNDVVAYINSLQ